MAWFSMKPPFKIRWRRYIISIFYITILSWNQLPMPKYYVPLLGRSLACIFHLIILTTYLITGMNSVITHKGNKVIRISWQKMVIDRKMVQTKIVAMGMSNHILRSRVKKLDQLEEFQVDNTEHQSVRVHHRLAERKR